MQELILEFFVVHIALLQILFIYHICVCVFQSEYVPVQSCLFNTYDISFKPLGAAFNVRTFAFCRRNT